MVFVEKLKEFFLKGLFPEPVGFYITDIPTNVDMEEQRLINLREQGKTQKEISEITGLTVNQVKGRIQKLLKAGKIQRVR